MPAPLDGTRLKIVALLQRQGPLTVEALSHEMGLAPATVRRHLDILQRDHLVTSEQARKKLGRPEWVYHLTEVGHEAGFRDYPTLLASLLSEAESLTADDLANGDSSNAVELLFNRISSRLVSHLQPADGASWEDRLGNLDQALTAQGFAPEVHLADDTVEIQLWNCPFRAVALCHGAVCMIDQQLIANTLGVEPVRQNTIRNGDACCSYLIRRTQATPPPEGPS